MNVHVKIYVRKSLFYSINNFGIAVWDFELIFCLILKLSSEKITN